MIKREQIDKLSQIQNAEKTLSPDVGYPFRELCVGEIFKKKYRILAKLDTPGECATLYTAEMAQREYVLKVFNNGYRGSEEIRSFLRTANNPSVIRLVDSGRVFSHEFEVYPFYHEGSLDNGEQVSQDKLIRDVIPTLNDALHDIHRKGIVHLDIKPANLFWTDYHRRVAIGDFGISRLSGERMLVESCGMGTTIYAPFLTEGIVFADCSFDYCSLGLTIYTLLTGTPLFHALTGEEIHAIWKNGVILPKTIDQRFQTLIEGLITPNAKERWGYIAVRQWCEQQRFIVNNPTQNGKKRSLLFGKVNGKFLMVDKLENLSTTLRLNWELATRVIKKRELIDFIQQFDSETARRAAELSYSSDTDASVFKLICILDKECSKLCYRDRYYASISDFISALSSGNDIIAQYILSSGLFTFFLREKGVKSEVVDALEKFIKKNGCTDTIGIAKICYAIQGNHSYNVFGTTVNSINDLPLVLNGHSIEEIIQLTKDSRFLAWLSVIGFEEDAKKLETWE